MRKNKNALKLFCCVLIMLFILFEAKSTYALKTNYIEQNGNLINDNLAVQYNNFTYYSLGEYCPLEGSDLNKINRCESNSKKFQQITNDTSRIIGIHGQWVYYRSANSKDYGSIYKIKNNGSSKKLLLKMNVPFDRVSFTSITAGLVKNKIAYLSPADESDISRYADYWNNNKLCPSKLNIMGIDGSGNKKLTQDIVYCINISGDWIYYTATDKSDGKFKLFKIKIDGTSRKVLSKKSISKFIVEGNEVYYLDSSKIGFGSLYKLDLASDKSNKICDNVAAFNIDKNYIYLSIEDKGLFKEKRTKGKLLKISKYRGTYYNICLSGGWIYTDFYLNSTEEEFVKIKTDGSQTIKINDMYQIYNTPKLYNKLYACYKCKYVKGELLYPKNWELYNYKNSATVYPTTDTRQIDSYGGGISGNFTCYRLHGNYLKGNECQIISTNKAKKIYFKTLQGRKGYYYIKNSNGSTDFGCYVASSKEAFEITLEFDKGIFNNYKSVIFDMMKRVKLD